MAKRKKKKIYKKRNIDVGPLPKIEDINYKNVAVLRKFVSNRYKIHPRKLTKVPAKMQRVITREIKKARIMGLLPYTERHEI